MPRSGWLVRGVHESGEEAASGAEGGADKEGGGGVEAGRGGGRGQQQGHRDQVQRQPVPGQHVGATLHDWVIDVLHFYVIINKYDFRKYEYFLDQNQYFNMCLLILYSL